MPKLFLHFGGKTPKQIIIFPMNPVSLRETVLTGRRALEPGFYCGFIITAHFNSLRHLTARVLYHFLPGHRMPSVLSLTPFQLHVFLFFVVYTTIKSLLHAFECQAGIFKDSHWLRMPRIRVAEAGGPSCHSA